MFIVRLVSGDMFSTKAVHMYFSESRQDVIIDQYGFPPDWRPTRFNLDELKERAWKETWTRQTIAGTDLLITNGLSVTILPFVSVGSQELRYAFWGIKFWCEEISQSLFIQPILKYSYFFHITPDPFVLPKQVPCPPEEYCGKPNPDMFLSLGNMNSIHQVLQAIIG